MTNDGLIILWLIGYGAMVFLIGVLVGNSI
jgi:hypothetical protein